MARNTAYLFLARAANGLTLLLVNVAVSRELGPFSFGVFAFVTTVVLTASFLADFGLDLLIVREVSQDPAGGRTRLGHVLALKVLAALATIAVLVFLFSLTPISPPTERLLWLYCSSLLLTGPMRALWHFADGFGSFASHASLWAGENLLKGAAALAALVIWRNLTAVVLGLIAAEAVALCATWVWVARRWGPIRFSPDTSAWISLVRRAAPLAAGSLLSVLYLRLDVVFLEVLRGETAVGLYSAAGKLVEALTILPTSLSLVVLAKLAQAARTTAPFEMIRRYLLLSFGAALAVAIPLALYSQSIITRVYGGEFEDAAVVLRVLSFGIGFLFMLPVLSSSLIALGRDTMNWLVLLSGSIVCTALHLALIPRFGPLGAAWATVVSEFSMVSLYGWALWMYR